jgi:DNA-binding HxlR family transcriptional regulator
VKFTDHKGRGWTLTRIQALYLAEASRQQLECGWGGLSSTLTVRLLEERGLITLARSSRRPRWTITSLTHLGRQVLDAWRELNRKERAA